MVPTAARASSIDRSWRLPFVERSCLVCGRSGRASGDGLRLCPFQDTKRSFGDALQRSKKGRTGGGFSQIRQGTASMRFHRMLFCRVCGCLMFDIGCADICVAYPDFGGRFWLVSVDSLQRIRRNYRGSIRNFRGLIQTNVFPRFTYRRTKKYRQATQLDKKVAHPAPAAPIPSPHGIMKIGSRIIFRKQPLIVPMLACRAAPSERTRYAITTFKIAGAAPRKTVQKR